MNLEGKTVLVTGGARRIGRMFCLACAKSGADIIIHHAHSPTEARTLREEIITLGRHAWILQCDFSKQENVTQLIQQATNISPLYALVNSASIFENLTLETTQLEQWNHHFNVNLTAPFLLSQAFARVVQTGRIVNILDWRALRPGADHFPYTITKAALAAMTKSLAVALSPNLSVNGLALGAILPPADKPVKNDAVIANVPAGRWSESSEVGEALLFLLTGPAYVTGEIVHLDGGRHLV